MSTDELSPEQEEQLIGEMLREKGGIDPGRLGPVIDLAALGLVNSAWRNTCVEDWHAEGRMHDGDMMRINSHMTWRTRQILRRWMTDTGLVADGPLSALDGVPAEDVKWLAIEGYNDYRLALSGTHNPRLRACAPPGVPADVGAAADGNAEARGRAGEPGMRRQARGLVGHG
jgi:hypothetical protein